MPGPKANPIWRLQEAALAYANAEDDGEHERAWMRLRFAALAYAKTPQPTGRPVTHRVIDGLKTKA